MLHISYYLILLSFQYSLSKCYVFPKQIDKYVKELEEERKAHEEEKRQRFEELQALLAEQAARDRERLVKLLSFSNHLYFSCRF